MKMFVLSMVSRSLFAFLLDVRISALRVQRRAGTCRADPVPASHDSSSSPSSSTSLPTLTTNERSKEDVSTREAQPTREPPAPTSSEDLASATPEPDKNENLATTIGIPSSEEAVLVVQRPTILIAVLRPEDQHAERTINDIEEFLSNFAGSPTSPSVENRREVANSPEDTTGDDEEESSSSSKVEVQVEEGRRNVLDSSEDAAPREEDERDRRRGKTSSQLSESSSPAPGINNKVFSEDVHKRVEAGSSEGASGEFARGVGEDLPSCCSSPGNPRRSNSYNKYCASTKKMQLGGKILCSIGILAGATSLARNSRIFTSTGGPRTSVIMDASSQQRHEPYAGVADAAAVVGWAGGREQSSRAILDEYSSSIAGGDILDHGQIGDGGTAWSCSANGIEGVASRASACGQGGEEPRGEGTNSTSTLFNITNISQHLVDEPWATQTLSLDPTPGLVVAGLTAVVAWWRGLFPQNVHVAGGPGAGADIAGSGAAEGTNASIMDVDLTVRSADMTRAEDQQEQFGQLSMSRSNLCGRSIPPCSSTNGTEWRFNTTGGGLKAADMSSPAMYHSPIRSTAASSPASSTPCGGTFSTPASPCYINDHSIHLHLHHDGAAPHGDGESSSSATTESLVLQLRQDTRGSASLSPGASSASQVLSAVSDAIEERTRIRSLKLTGDDVAHIQRGTSLSSTGGTVTPTSSSSAAPPTAPKLPPLVFLDLQLLRDREQERLRLGKKMNISRSGEEQQAAISSEGSTRCPSAESEARSRSPTLLRNKVMKAIPPLVEKSPPSRRSAHRDALVRWREVQKRTVRKFTEQQQSRGCRQRSEQEEAADENMEK
ncbi:unnamed protein product [Amoebophrya sp. A25]|nr:unnamed protein product [Amoebophrya sp. A25]|eukprot:GSA25T00020776001.1